MKTQMINIPNKGSFLDVELVEIIQKDKSFYIAKILAKDFLNLFTVRPAQYDLLKHSELAKNFPDDDNYFKHLINQDLKNLKNDGFQRDPNFDRISKISKFLNNEDYALFPNTIIANCELINDWPDFNFTENNSFDDFINSEKPSYLSFLKKDGESYHLFIPYIENSILVIDGQHRLEGLKRSSDNIIQNYELVIAFIIGFDRAVIAKQFYTINYEQKAVNKSLLYQLTGEFSTEVDELSFMHNVVKLLNELDDSPFYGRIKMLGITPKDFTKEQKEKLSISQAFLIDALIRYVSSSAKNSTYPPIFLTYYMNPEEHIFIVRAIARFFKAVKQIKPEWDNPNESLLSKGMGVGALIKVFNLLFPIIFKKEMENDLTKIKDLTVEKYVIILKGLENIDFSSNGPFGKTGSAGSINKIKDEIIKSLEYLDTPETIEIFEAIYKQDFLLNFNNQLNKNTTILK